MLIAALAADGVSEIGNIRQIDRGYEQIDERLRSLGARIERVSAEIPRRPRLELDGCHWRAPDQAEQGRREAE